MRLNEIQIAHILDEARRLAGEEKYLHAAQMYERLIHLEPSLVLPYLELSSIYASIERTDSAILLLIRARRRFARDSDVLFKLGAYYLQCGDFRNALLCYKKIRDEKNAQVHYQMGVAYYLSENPDEAEREFRHALAVDPNFPYVNEAIGEVLMKKGLFAGAAKSIERGIIREPYCGTSHCLLGIAFGHLGSWKSAYDEFVLSIDMDPKEAAHWQFCGEALVHLERYDEAEQYLKKSVELDSKIVETHLHLGRIYLRKKNYALALDSIHRAVDLDPDNAEATEMLRCVPGSRMKLTKAKNPAELIAR